MEAEETVILPREEIESELQKENNLLRDLDRVAEVLAHFAENVHRLSAQAELMRMEQEARSALILYAGLSGALICFNRDRKGA